MQVDQRAGACFCHAFDLLLDPGGPVRDAGGGAKMAVEDRGKRANENPHFFGGSPLECSRQFHIVSEKLVTMVRPRANIVIINPQRDDDDIRSERQSFPVFAGSRVRAVSLRQQRGSGYPEIPNPIPRAQHRLQPGRPAVHLATGDFRSESDRIPDAGDADGTVLNPFSPATQLTQAE